MGPYTKSSAPRRPHQPRWEIMIFLGFNAANSVRISNELGAGRPRAAKFSIPVVVLSSALIGVVFLAPRLGTQGCICSTLHK
ncbi:hypothetical protein IFM89_025571 [Coptis chinensis]|uniref:Uncharacterized protein n=1 Tax=Coptis chinensis TaxID=261450 RepID=A0A835IPQ6_9MAGN|nr:hypothetical protein IFM89_025571 [Coptis chinensis]